MRLLPVVPLWLAVAVSVAAAAPSDADAVKAAELERYKVTTAGDLEALARLLADDLTYAHSSGLLETKAQYLESLRSGRVKYQTIEPSDLQVRLYGATAVITGKAKIALVSEGTPKSFELRFTDVWAKRRGRWQMVAWQSTRLP